VINDFCARQFGQVATCATPFSAVFAVSQASTEVVTSTTGRNTNRTIAGKLLKSGVSSEDFKL